MKTSEVWTRIEVLIKKERAWQVTCKKSPSEINAYLVGYEQGMQVLLTDLIKAGVINDSVQERFDARMAEEAEHSFKLGRDYDKTIAYNIRRNQ